MKDWLLTSWIEAPNYWIQFYEGGRTVAAGMLFRVQSTIARL